MFSRTDVEWDSRSPIGEIHAEQKAWNPLRAATRTFDDRKVLVGLAILLPVALAVSSWALALDIGQWRTDTMQAVDRAGLYLFILNPCYAGICAWRAVSAYTAFGATIDGLPDDSLIWRRSWVPFALAGVVFHTVYLGALLVIAETSSSSGSIDLFPIVVQLLSIPFFCALGAAVGGHWRAVVAPPVLFLALLTGNTLLVQYGFRRISEVGTGSADFIDMQLSLGYLLPKALLFVAGTVYALPFRFSRRTPRRLQRVVPALTGVLMIVMIFVGTEQPQIYRPGTPVCHMTDDALRLCAPPDVAEFAGEYDAPVDRVAQVIASTGATAVPANVSLVSRGATSLPARTVTFAVTSTSVRQHDTRLRDVVFGYAYAEWCDAPTSQIAPPPGVIETHGLLDGWLQHQVGLDEPGTYPSDELAALESLPTAQQLTEVRRMLNGAWTCDRTLQPYHPPKASG